MTNELRQGIEEVHGDNLDADFIEACTLLQECTILIKSAAQDITEIVGEIDN